MDSRGNVDVLLINPPSFRGKQGRGSFFTPPMGLAYLASNLQKNAITVEIIDCNSERLYLDYPLPSKYQQRKLESRLSLYTSPVLVGIGPVTTPFLRNSISLAETAKKILHNSFLVLGGPHCSLEEPEMAFRMITRFAFIDAICINEGEVSKTMKL